MKTLLASFVATGLACALATAAHAGPDFTSRSPRTHPLAASTGTSEIGPLDDVVFAHDSTTLTDTDHAQIVSAARWLERHRDQRVVLEGYADSTGYFIYNEDLATRRAFMVRRQLIAEGIAPDRIIVVTYGELSAIGGENPLDRRVVMYATELGPAKIAAASFDLKFALSTTWTKNTTRFTETRRGTERTTTVIGTR